MHTCRTLLIVLALAVPVQTFAAADQVPTIEPPITGGGPRLRPYDRRAAALLLEGLRRSDRLRTLVDDLERSDVIVYVQMQHLLRGKWAGALTWIAGTKQFRYVRVSLNPAIRGAMAIATLGHELQHALEVANEPSIVDAQSLNGFYRQHGISMRVQNGWDTEAARLVGEEVRQDLSESHDGLIMESMNDFDPLEWQVVYRRSRERR